MLAQRLVRVLNPGDARGVHGRRIRAAAAQPARGRAVAHAVPPGGARHERRLQGRTGIYELVLVDEHMRTMIHDGASEQELERYARSRTPGIRDDGRAKVLAGVTTIEEVLKVTRED